MSERAAEPVWDEDAYRLVRADRQRELTQRRRGAANAMSLMKVAKTREADPAVQVDGVSRISAATAGFVDRPEPPEVADRGTVASVTESATPKFVEEKPEEIEVVPGEFAQVPAAEIAELAAEETDELVAPDEIAKPREVVAPVSPEAQLDTRDFDARAADIALTVTNPRYESLRAGMAAAYIEYVQPKDENRQLRRFGMVLLMVPDMVAYDETYNDLVETRRDKAGVVLAGERPAKGLSLGERLRFEESRRKKCSYNHLLQGLVEQNKDFLPPDRMHRWIRDAGSDDEFARGIVHGVQGEIAGLELMHAVPGLEEAKHGSLDDDLAGRDITFSKNRVGHDHVDVKIREHSRGIRPVMVERDEIGGKSRRVVTLNISPSHLDSHRWAVKEEAAEVYRLCLQKVLVEGEELNEETLKVIYKQVEADRVGRESEEAAEAA